MMIKIAEADNNINNNNNTHKKEQRLQKTNKTTMIKIVANKPTSASLPDKDSTEILLSDIPAT